MNKLINDFSTRDEMSVQNTRDPRDFSDKIFVQKIDEQLSLEWMLSWSHFRNGNIWSLLINV